MKPNPVKQTLQQGGTSIGTFLLEFNTPGISRIVAEAGAEFCIFDMEHTGWSVETIRTLMATAAGTALVPVVRVPAVEYHFIARVLDVGAMGVMAPMVESAEQARRLAQSTKYPPVGRRGAAFGIAHDGYTGGAVAEKMAALNRDTLVIAQIETADGLRNVDEIAAVEGIDVLWIGHFDLTNSLGIPGQFEHPDYFAALDRVLAACEAHGKIPGFLAGDVATGRDLLDRGFRMLAFGGDVWLYQAALQHGIAELKERHNRARSN